MSASLKAGGLRAPHRSFSVIAGLATVLASASASATPYWVNWDGADWPEASGYSRSWGNAEGPHLGGAFRTLEDGVLTYDSLYDSSVYDSYYMNRAIGTMDCGPGEQFVMEWRLKVDTVNGPDDPGVAFYSDDGFGLGFAYTEDHIRSIFEGYLNIPFVPYVWHDYRVSSIDMRTYDFYIDGVWVRHGWLVDVPTRAYAGFGEGTQGAASVHHWDYVRWGVTPEPTTLLMLIMWPFVWHRARRG